MRHFRDLPEPALQRLFAHPPQRFDAGSDPEEIGIALGATLYMPATRPTLARDLARQGEAGAVSAVVCLEDAIADRDVAAAQANAIAQLRDLAEHATGPETVDAVPLVFVRVRQPEQIPRIVAGLGAHADVLAGFVLPKFTDLRGAAFLDALEDTAAATGLRLLAMPVIESPEVIHRESRTETLLGVSRLLAKHRGIIPAVRIGATDLCAALGIRRGRELTIYDVGPVADVIYDVVNILGRADGTGFTVTGPVWEYFPDRDRLFKPQLRTSPFVEHHAPALRHALITADLDGLIREIVLDRANGLMGKTVIHPSHVPAVRALSVVSMEEFSDATDVLGQHAAGGGVSASGYRNKMNESGPHLAWAQRTLARGRAFGVAAEHVGLVDFLTAGQAS